MATDRTSHPANILNSFAEWEWSSVVIIISLVMIGDNLCSFYFARNLINDLIMPCTATLALIQFMFGVVNVIAFSSFYIQIDLILADGVDPAHRRLAKWYEIYPLSDPSKSKFEIWRDRLKNRASIFWLGSSDSFIRRVTFIGILNGLTISLLATRIVMADPSLCFLFCFAVNALFYLSLIQISGDFLRLQSDSNLVEINFVMAVCSAFNRRYPSVCVMVLRWLGFRIMLACGLCKWNGSKMWKQLTAMMHHYYTQPLPNPISYYIHQCPKWMHASSVLMTFIVEGPLGFCIFGPSWSRYLAFIGFEAINLMINTTGNYGFIGALNMTVNMCFLDDSVIAVLPLPISIVDYIESMESISPLSVHWQWFEWITIPPTISLMALYVAASWIPFCSTSKRYILPFQSRSVCRLHEYFQRYRLVNRYAKFGSMHEGRYEFVVEGSANGKEWKEYSFLFKPSTATQIPAVVPLHIPQLDWMTWFLPLRWKRFGALQRTYYMHNAQGMSYTAPDWWYALERKLKENSEGILKVIKFNPFPIRGPKLIRTSVRQFEFVPWNERNDKESEDGARVWWKTKTVAVLRSRHAT